MSQSAWDPLLDSLWPLTPGAVTGTIPLALMSFAVGLVLALLLALMRLSRRWWLSGITRGYISIVRGTPLLVQLFVIFYGLGPPSASSHRPVAERLHRLLHPF